ncbi:PepSY domain-containing protein [Nitrospirillum sp. BR 11828]|uniref:PepSY domain-containing protein n=1 Tax=Nitrospirillum sp. BR 11828 TaxID=3104325 RepID=UPI002ACA0501|nr:PepSY domain-containing protein [Nitrospirillum sp. BR 11828]MDZ5650063.1 PepSY domain-containing protein [Nitrospirillum sp. BR 11828]
MRWIAALFLPMLATLAVPAALADTDQDQDRARAAVEQGRALPLRTILDRAAERFPGQLLEAELEEEHGRLVYEIKLLMDGGRVVKLHYDARTGDLLAVKERGAEKDRRP